VNKVSKYKFNLSLKHSFWLEDHENNFKFICDYYKKYVEQNKLRGLNFLEIGTCEGFTAIWLLDNILTRDNDSLTCIDPDPSSLFYKNIESHKWKVEIEKRYSSECLPLFRVQWKLFDFIYVDGDHNAAGVLEDMVLSWRLLKPGGIMLVDDYEMKALDPWFYKSHPEFKNNPRLNWQHPSLAINSFLSIYRGCFELLIDNYQVGLRKLTQIGGKNLNCGKSLEGY